ncbi:hypothetical protein NPIL_245911 [Nephila pilipes]|uniref:Uncharacterized protein n=1 Tax=Nephila pilipes TaxID=299642 RepID=A0A8X6MCF4_NEPPI|nr:hypothetical protein NPIL_245911 [Nephila pilipes]
MGSRFLPVQSPEQTLEDDGLKMCMSRNRVKENKAWDPAIPTVQNNPAFHAPPGDGRIVQRNTTRNEENEQANEIRAAAKSHPQRRCRGVIVSVGCTEGIRCFSGAEPYQFRQRNTTNGRWERLSDVANRTLPRPTEVEASFYFQSINQSFSNGGEEKLDNDFPSRLNHATTVIPPRWYMKYKNGFKNQQPH